jgi:hypothetical protein
MLFALVIAALPASCFAGVFVSVAIAPPALPVYVQPVCPAPGYMWTPGYWAYGPAGYYWVPGVWVRPPMVGLLWTPGYWGWGGGVYMWHAGYWGPHVGFYGGVNYGFGYGGVGFFGGEWRGGSFFYNTAVVNVNRTVIHNTYINRTVINNTTINRVSYNGGAGGIQARPTAEQMQAQRSARYSATQAQVQHREFAGNNRSQLYSQNHGRPEVAARESVNGRAFNQQGRIAQGVRTGQMSQGEAMRDEQRQQRIDNSVRQDRMENGGRMTPQERQNINRRQNNASRQIYNQRHEGRGNEGERGRR